MYASFIASSSMRSTASWTHPHRRCSVPLYALVRAQPAHLRPLRSLIAYGIAVPKCRLVCADRSARTQPLAAVSVSGSMMWSVSRIPDGGGSEAIRTVAVLAGSLVVAASACGPTSETTESEFRIYDPTGKAGAQITTADIDRSSAGLLPLENVRAAVYVNFTDSGTSKFCRLTRSLAHRGRTLRTAQSFVIEISGRERRRPTIDYEANPNGFCDAPGIQIDGLPLVEAHILVEAIRG